MASGFWSGLLALYFENSEFGAHLLAKEGPEDHRLPVLANGGFVKPPYETPEKSTCRNLMLLRNRVYSFFNLAGRHLAGRVQTQVREMHLAELLCRKQKEGLPGCCSTRSDQHAHVPVTKKKKHVGDFWAFQGMSKSPPENLPINISPSISLPRRDFAPLAKVQDFGLWGAISECTLAKGGRLCVALSSRHVCRNPPMTLANSL